MSKDVRVVQTKRRTWDEEEYRQRAEERDRGETPSRLPPGVARPAAQSHDQTYNLDVNVGKTQVAGKDAGGFRCEICDCTLRDSIAWLDHRNGVKHQKNLGFSVRSERASVDDVRQRLQAHKEKHAAESNYDLEDRVKRLKDEEEKQKQLAKEQKRAKKRKIDEDEPFVKGAVTDKQDTTREPEDNKKELQEAIKEAAPEMTEEERMLAMLGLPGGFGSSKK